MRRPRWRQRRRLRFVWGTDRSRAEISAKTTVVPMRSDWPSASERAHTLPKNKQTGRNPAGQMVSFRLSFGAIASCVSSCSKGCSESKRAGETTRVRRRWMDGWTPDAARWMRRLASYRFGV
jgi:hypothetical protein